MENIITRIQNFNKGLLPDMVELKYKLIAENPFSFFRGTCHLFYEDLRRVRKFPASPLVWICGDLHLENFGSFKGNNRQEYFDLNDFDEAILAPLTWEVARIVTSIYVAFDSLTINRKEADEMAALFLTTYTATLKAGKAHYIDPRTAKGIVHQFLKTVKKRKEKELVKKLAMPGENGFKIRIDKKKHLKLDDDLKSELMLFLSQWIKGCEDWPRHYKVLDAAFRVAGTGSLGLKRYMFLLQNTKNKRKYLVLEMKEARQSSVAPYLKVRQPAWSSEAERVIAVKRRMQNVSPALLNIVDFKDEPYIVQEMQPMADKIDFNLIRDQYKCLSRVLKDMAVLTASAQLRSGGISGSAIIDELTAFGNTAGWQQPLLKYAQKYALQVQKDFAEFKNR